MRMVFVFAVIFLFLLDVMPIRVSAQERPCGIVAVIFHPQVRLGGQWSWWGFDKEPVRVGIERAFHERGLGYGAMWPRGVPNTVQELYSMYDSAIRAGQIRCIAEVYSAQVTNREQLGSSTVRYGGFSLSGTLHRVSVNLGFRFARIFSAESLPVVEHYPEASGSAFGLIAASGYSGSRGAGVNTSYGSQRDLDAEAFKNAALEIIKLLPLPQGVPASTLAPIPASGSYPAERP